MFPIFTIIIITAVAYYLFRGEANASNAMDITMTFTSPNNCGHIHVNVSAGAKSKTFIFNREDFKLDPDDVEPIVLALVRNTIKTNNITTLAGLKTAMEGKTYKI